MFAPKTTVSAAALAFPEPAQAAGTGKATEKKSGRPLLLVLPLQLLASLVQPRQSSDFLWHWLDFSR